MRFLCNGEAILQEVKKMCKSEKPLYIAVSYWGQDILEETNLREKVSDHKNVFVLCDLSSPGCNPEPIESLFKIGEDEAKTVVKTVPNLHAKVWICGEKAIVSSANFSKYGMGIAAKDDRSSAKIEAGMLVTKTELVEEILTWFDRLWSDKAKKIEEQDLEAAKIGRERRSREKQSKKSKKDAVQQFDSENALDESELTIKPEHVKALQRLNSHSKVGDRRKEFFRILLDALNDNGITQAQDVKPSELARLSIRTNEARGRNTGVRYFFCVRSFQDSKWVTKVELSIGFDEKKMNLKRYKKLERKKDEIEDRIGETKLVWEEKKDKDLSTISAVYPGTIHHGHSDPEVILKWIVKTTIAFHRTFTHYLSE